ADIIVGFPGETEDDFRETLEVVEEAGFDSAFTFVYSPRAGTDAAAMPDQVPDDIKRERIERLVDQVQRIAAKRNESRLGRVEEVLVEGRGRYFRENFAQAGIDLVQIVPELVTNADAAIAAAGRARGRIDLRFAPPDPAFLARWKPEVRRLRVPALRDWRHEVVCADDGE